MNIMNNELTTEVKVMSLIIPTMEQWRDQWFRNGKLMLMRKRTSNYSVSRTLREMHNVETTLSADLWCKCQRHLPLVTREQFMSVFRPLMTQAYRGLKEDLDYLVKEKEEFERRHQ